LELVIAIVVFGLVPMVMTVALLVSWRKRRAGAATVAVAGDQAAGRSSPGSPDGYRGYGRPPAHT
jgi:uncharacterized iron-regulated membrane protein